MFTTRKMAEMADLKDRYFEEWKNAQTQLNKARAALKTIVAVTAGPCKRTPEAEQIAITRGIIAEEALKEIE